MRWVQQGDHLGSYCDVHRRESNWGDALVIVLRDSVGHQKREMLGQVWVEGDNPKSETGHR